MCFEHDVDEFFIQTILICRKYIFSSLDIFGYAIQLLIPHFNKESELLNDTEQIVQSVFRVLCIWISIDSSDFVSPELSALLPTLTHMLGFDEIEIFGGEMMSNPSMLPISNVGTKNYIQIFKQKLIHSLHLSKEAQALQTGEGLQSTRAKAIRTLHQIQWGYMLNLNEDFINNVSVALLSTTQRIQKKIAADELVSYPLSYKANVQSPNIKEYTEYLNDICRWVEILVLSSADSSERAKVITFFIFLLDKSRELRSYSVCMGIYMGLSSSPVQRYIFYCSFISTVSLYIYYIKA
jgi:hypothetical protein